MVCQLDVALNGVTLYDSQRSSLSKRNLDADTISYCGLTRYVLITGLFTVYTMAIKHCLRYSIRGLAFRSLRNKNSICKLSCCDEFVCDAGKG